MKMSEFFAVFVEHRYRGVVSVGCINNFMRDCINDALSDYDSNVSSGKDKNLSLNYGIETLDTIERYRDQDKWSRINKLSSELEDCGDVDFLRWQVDSGDGWRVAKSVDDILDSVRAVQKQKQAGNKENKYMREIKPGVFVDVYDVLKAFSVECPAMQHAAKKVLCAGLRGHKDAAKDKGESIKSIERSMELDNEAPKFTGRTVRNQSKG